ncbi:PH domain-containing protein [Tolypocladium capitatum]|uniref:PH domain-containing protein n=1 Tax=Tolypocladium capitatum TaxID=45235 RepID=A0A2K3QB81_9HYPO|nr:PH domain-containing protein [Tolypocladium capitatum]
MSKAAASPAAAPRPLDRGIPVGLNEAALDSPTFRASAAHFTDQIDALERWLNGYVSSTSRLVHDILALEETVNTYLSKTGPSAADGIIENDYALLALKRVGDGQRECWMQTLGSMHRMDGLVIEPIRSFLGGDMRNFKEVRRTLEQTQRAYDSMLARYVAQSKTKEPSALREDAFSVYENRKAYVQASMDYCQLAPQLRFAMDKLLVKVCSEIWNEMRRSRDASTNATRWTREMDRVRGWAKEMELSEGFFKRELKMARRELGEATFEEFKPSRELEDYSTSTVPFLGSRGPLNMRVKDESAVISEKQGWLFLRMVSGKPVRYNWVRRWYYCRDGVFGWLVPGPQGVLQGDEIGVLLCNAKPAVGEERRFCFEVKTKNQTMTLQTETQRELMEWLEVFEVTKTKAFETSVCREPSSRQGGVDPAFLISPPSAPEFSAKAVDSQMGAADDVGPGLERSATLVVPGQDGHLGARLSADVNGRRSFTALGRDLATREDGESGREHAARIIQKLDLHRKTTFGSGIEPGPAAPGSTSSGGIAGLISASHNLLPINPSNSSQNAPRHALGVMPSLNSTPGSLAPLTLARPPSMTTLSRTAVVVTGERSSITNSRKLPTSIVANYWGSNVWSTMNTPEQPVLPRLDEDDPIGVVVPESSQTSLTRAAENQVNRQLPLNYPAELRAQNAQFRLLFPNAPPGEKLVLVFRAAWSSSRERDSPNETLAGDGRIYVTPDNMYFYSQQMGLVTAYSIHLDIIAEVTSAAGRDCDFVFLHLGQDTNETGYTRITIKVFLDDLNLLHARLNLLVDNLQAEEPMDTGDIISSLISIEGDDFDKPSPSAESWEEVSSHTPADDGTSSGRPAARHHLHHHAHLPPSRSLQRLLPKLHLPTRPVVYEPEGMTEMAADRHFEISAKACFHVLFGDKSFVFPKLYFEHRAQQIAQGPWVLVDQGRMRRDFHFKVDYVDMLGRCKSDNINDHQTIDVYSDHVTYVVTHVKTAWHLPHSRSFKLVTKIVITHVAKSKCKLAVYIRIDWSKAPALSKNLVERQALHDAANDAEELAEMATEQVRKLGPRSRTNRAIQVYGHVGQQTQVVVFSPAATESSRKQAIKPRTLTTMLLETARSFAESAVSSLIMWAIAALRKLFGVISAQRLTLALLGFSALTNLLLTSTESSAWWRERSAARFMQRMGVAPNPMMSKAIYIADLDEASAATGNRPWFPANSTCFGTYRELLDATDADAPWEDAGAALTSPSSRATARRLRRTRQRLGSYRHDLLVAMRVVNSIEREMLQSEWENWLINEKSLCDDLDSLLQAGGGKGADRGQPRGESRTQKVLGSMEKDGKTALEEWRDSYCGSCREDALGPIDWADVPQDGLETFLGGVFAEAQTVVESVPSPAMAPAETTPTGRARAKTDSAVVYADARQSPSPPGALSCAGAADRLRKEWKEIKVNPRDNPLAISVYKLAGKDGRGTWFARRSVHVGLAFDRWKDGLEREFAETMKLQGSPGSGNIRGIGADRNVEHRVVEGAGHLNGSVAALCPSSPWANTDLSAQFPGPTSPRDFITLLLTSDFASEQPDQPRPLRRYMVVSKPCMHPECPPRQGIVRGQYESVEIIREIASESTANKRSFSYADLTLDDGGRVSTTKPPDEAPRAVEWLMVTRSDPGGSVPRFMIEKGTPPGIVGDAGKFLNWITSTTADHPSVPAQDIFGTNGNARDAANNRSAGAAEVSNNDSGQNQEAGGDEGIPSSNGLYGIITGAFGAATSVAYGLRQQFSSPLGFGSSQDSHSETTEAGPKGEDMDDDEDSDGDASSTLSFASALENSVIEDRGLDSITGSNSDASRSQLKQPAEKELQKLIERRRRLEETHSRMQERLESKRHGEKEKDAAAMAKVREKHDKELAKQEAKYRREMRKLEEKREQEERKAEARRRKAIEREEKANLTLELDRIKAERDVALKRVELLQGQVGELQAQNTMLVAQLGRMGGISREKLVVL